MKPLRIAAVAADEVRGARDWYERRAPGLGKRFINAVDHVLGGVAERPQRYPLVHRDIRRAMARPFPYSRHRGGAPASRSGYLEAPRVEGVKVRAAAQRAGPDGARLGALTGLSAKAETPG
jgi:hypothetical protein